MTDHRLYHCLLNGPDPAFFVRPLADKLAELSPQGPVQDLLLSLRDSLLLHSYKRFLSCLLSILLYLVKNRNVFPVFLPKTKYNREYIKVKKESWSEHDKITIANREPSRGAKVCQN